MCPKPNATRNGLSSKSHVEDLEGIPGLFKALTDVDEDDWSTMTYPVDFDAALYGAKFDWDMAVVSREYSTTSCAHPHVIFTHPITQMAASAPSRSSTMLQPPPAATATR